MADEISPPLGLIEEEEKEHALHLTEMCKDAKRRYSRFKNEKKFKELVQEFHYLPFAVYLYQKLEVGSEKDSAYLNPLYLFKRVDEMIHKDGHEKLSLSVCI